jgi:hypothetical protein
MKYGNNFDAFATSVDCDLGGACHDQLARVRYAPDAAHSWMEGENGNGLDNAADDFLSCFRTIQFYVRADLIQVLKCGIGPGNFIHSG